MIHYLKVMAVFLRNTRSKSISLFDQFFFYCLLILAVGFFLVYKPAPAMAQTTPGTLSPPANNQSSSNQAATGSISGKVINGTAGAGFEANVLKEQTVKLERITGSDTTTVDERETKLDPAGNFVFQGLDVSENYTYYVSTRYAGVTYYLPQSLSLTTAKPVQAAELKVYEPTNDQTVVSVAGTSVIVPQVDPDSGQIFILEMYSVVNKGDRTFTGTGPKTSPATSNPSPGASPTQIPAVSAASTPASNPNPANSVTLRFFLPSGAKGISPASGLDPGDVIETTDGLEVTAPILPGENQLVFSYILPYQAESFSFSKRLAYDTPSFRFFTPVSGPSATSPQLSAGQVIEMGQQKLVPLSGQNFKADTQLKIELTGLPLPPSKGTTATRDNLLKLGTLFITLIGLVFLVVYARGSRKVKVDWPATAATGFSQSPASPAAAAPGAGSHASPASDLQLERQQLLENMARLDLNYQKGGFKGKEAAYQTRRANLKARLIEVWELTLPDHVTCAPAPAGSLQMAATHADLKSPNSVVIEEEF